MAKGNQACEYCFDSLGSKSRIRPVQAYKGSIRAVGYGRNDNLTPEERVMASIPEVPEYTTKASKSVASYLGKSTARLLSLELL